MMTVSFRIPASDVRRVEKHCKKTKESKSSFFRRAIETTLKADDDRANGEGMGSEE